MMVSFGLVMFGITGITPIILGGVASQRGWLWLINFAMFLNVLGAGALLLGWYFFPDGRFIPGWTRWLAFAFAAWTVVILITGGTGSWSFLTHFWASAGWYSTGALAQIYRYIRVSSPIQQQQTKWVVFGSTLAFFAFVVRTLPIVLAPSLFKPGIFSLLYTLLTRPLMYLFMLLIPLSIGISILRYRLWDIDILIRRTLIYGVLTAALALIYFGGVVMLQVGFRALTGQTSQLAIVASTLTITALFSPLRGRVQMTIDRRFYRHKYNAAQALAAFSATVRDEVDLNRLTGQLLALVEEFPWAGAHHDE
jgi:hypothetical protein